LDMTGIVADIVRQTVSQHEDIEIVASLPDANGLESVTETADVDLVITAYRPNQSDLGRFDRALAAKPGLRVLAIEGEGRTACMYTLLPHTRQLGPLSPRTLIGFIRASAASPSAPGQ
jgi:hypothetical protein